MTKIKNPRQNSEAANSVARTKPILPTTIIRIPIADLKRDPRNPRLHSDRQIEQLAKSIDNFGFLWPVMIDGTKRVLAGHGRIEAAKRLGFQEVPTISIQHLSESQRRAFMIADNRLAEQASWDEKLLAEQLKELCEVDLDFDLEAIGFEVGEIDVLIEGASPDTQGDSDSADDLPEGTPVAVTQPGDLWLLGPHRVLCGDATSVEAVARLLGERKPRLMVCDPPYGIELDSEWRDRAGLNGHGPAEPSYMKKRTKGYNETSISGDTRADWSEAFALVPSLDVAYVWHASKFTREVLDGLLKIGFVHHQQIIWDKGRTVLTRTLYWFQHEPCWFVRRRKPLGSARRERTRPSGRRLRRKSLWVEVMRRSGIIQRRSQSNSCGARSSIICGTVNWSTIPSPAAGQRSRPRN